MESSCKGLDVFDFKEEDGVPEFAAAMYSSKIKDSKDIDKYTFLENVAQGTNNLSKEIINRLCVDTDAINSDHNGDSAVSFTSLDAGEDCAIKRMAGLDAVPQTNSMIPEQLPQFRLNKLEPRSSFSGVDGSSSPAAASPGNGKLNCALLESSFCDDSIDVVSNADESMSQRSPASSSDIAEDDVPLDGPSSDHCFGGWEMGDGDMSVVFCPDYIVYRDRYCTDAVLTFSSSYVEINCSTAYGDLGTLVFQWAIDDIIGIESQWCGRFEMATVKIRVSSKDSVQAEDMHGTSGIEELKFAVVDSDWYEKQEAITSLDVYKALWNIMLDSDMERDGEASLGQDAILYSKHYFPDFDAPFEDVVYPKGDSDAVSISKRDVDLLQPDTFVNDTIIDFYIKYLKNKIQPDERHRFHFFNSFFFRKLVDLDKDPSSVLDARAAFQRVRKWTRKLNLFEKDYVFVPVNFNYHWSLLVICHPGEVATYEDEDVVKSLKVPSILHMDSIRGSHTGLKDLLQSYLWEEWKERQKETSEDISSRFFNLRFVSLELPQQQNSFDCGLFLLHYAELFLEEAPVNFNPFKITKFSKFLNMDWFQPAEASLKRVLIQRLIYALLDNCSPEISPDAGNGKHHISNCPKSIIDNEITLEFVSDRCIHPKATDGNVPSSQAGEGIEITLLTTSSLKSSQCASDSGFILREFFEREAAVGSLLDTQYQTFDQRSHFDEFKSAMSPIEEEGEAGGHFVSSPSMENGLQQLAGITPESCPFPCTSGDFRAEPSWNPRISIHQPVHEDIDSSPKTSICASDDSLHRQANENIQAGKDLGSEEKIDQPESSLIANIGCLTESFASAPNEMPGLDSGYTIQTLDSLTCSPKNLLGLGLQVSDVQENGKKLPGFCHQVSGVQANGKNLPGFCPQVSDVQENANNLPGFCPQDSNVQENGSTDCYDLALESDMHPAAKRLRLTPRLEGEGDLSRSMSEDLHL